MRTLVLFLLIIIICTCFRNSFFKKWWSLKCENPPKNPRLKFTFFSIVNDYKENACIEKVKFLTEKKEATHVSCDPSTSISLYLYTSLFLNLYLPIFLSKKDRRTTVRQIYIEAVFSKPLPENPWARENTSTSKGY